MSRLPRLAVCFVLLLFPIHGNSSESVSQEFLDEMARLESSSTPTRPNYSVVNNLGYLGKYQFSPRTLRGLRFTSGEIEDFLFNPELQEQAMIRLVKENRRILFGSYNLGSFIGQHIKGIGITEHGMLAAAHLVGPFAVKKFLISHGNYMYEDAYETPLTKYLKVFDTLEGKVLNRQIRHHWVSMYDFSFRRYEDAFPTGSGKHAELFWSSILAFAHAKKEEASFSFLHPQNDLSDLL